MKNVIKLNGKEIYFNNIVGYGCSFMSGAESCDDIIRIDMDHDAVNYVKKTGNNFWKDYLRAEDVASGFINSCFVTNNMLDWNKVIEYEKENSWFNLFVKNFECSYLNRSESGGSFCGMQYKHMQDVVTNSINSDDLIIIGLTSPNRFWYMDASGVRHNALLGWKNHGWPELSPRIIDEDFYNKYVSYLGNKNNVLWQMMRSIYYFKNLKNPIIFVPQFTTNYLESNFNYNPIIKQLLENFLNSPELVSLNMNFTDMFDDFFYGPSDSLVPGRPSTSPAMCGLHPNRQQHQQFANNIYNYLKT